jgi:hypothetical protein
MRRLDPTIGSDEPLDDGQVAGNGPHYTAARWTTAFAGPR